MLPHMEKEMCAISAANVCQQQYFSYPDREQREAYGSQKKEDKKKYKHAKEKLRNAEEKYVQAERDLRKAQRKYREAEVSYKGDDWGHGMDGGDFGSIMIRNFFDHL